MCLSDGVEVVDWNAVLEAMRAGINPRRFRTWLEPTGPARVVGDAVVVEVPSRPFGVFIDQTWGFEIRGQLKKRGFAGMALRFKSRAR